MSTSNNNQSSSTRTDNHNRKFQSIIRPIDPTSIHRITSGQVVVDLQTAVKELVENSLDAGSTTIDVKFKEYGLESIQVSDNGSGIREDDLSTVALNHHTSKLSTFDGLDKVKTFGFRGEALSSLCALAKVTIQTSTAGTTPKGWELEFDKMGNLISKKSCHRSQGTTVFVRSLFHNLPVRRKQFTKDNKKYFNQALNLLQAYGLISTNLNLNVSNQSSKGNKSYQFQTKCNDHFKQNFSNIFTAKSCNLIIDLDLKLRVKPDKTVLRAIGKSLNDSWAEDIYNTVSVEGLISRPVHGQGRNSSDRQFYYINGRPFNPNKISKCFNEVYKQFNTNQYPVVLANFILPEDSYDVNVDPNKRTIFLHSEGNLIEALREALEEAFQPHRSTFSISQLNSTQTTLASQSLNLSFLPPTSSKRRREDLGGNAPHESDNQSSTESSAKASHPNQESSEPDSQTGEATPPQRNTTADKDYSQTSSFSNDNTQDLNSTKKVRLERSSPPLEDVNMNLPSSSAEELKQQPLFLPEPPPPPPSSSVFGEKATGGNTAEPSGDDADSDEEIIPLLATPAAPPPEQEWVPSEMRSKAATDGGSNKKVQMTLDTSGARWNLERLERQTQGSVRSSAKKKKVVSSSDRLKNSLQRFVRGGSVAAQVTPNDEDEEEEEEEEEGEKSETEKEREDAEEADELLLAEDPFNNGPQDAEDGVEEVAETKGYGDEKSEKSEPTRILKERDPKYPPGANSNCGNKDHERLVEAKTSARKEIIIEREPGSMTVKVDLDSIKKFWESKRRAREEKRDSNLNVRAQLRKTDGERSDQSNVLEGAGLDETDESRAEEVLSRKVCKTDFSSRMKVIGQFNLGFIIVRRRKRSSVEEEEEEGGGGGGDEDEDDLFIIDQHASDEKFNFEKLQRETKLTGQRLLTPKILNLTATQELTAIENLEVLEFNGFGLNVNEDERIGERIKLVSQPVWGGNTWDSTDLEELLNLIESKGNQKEIVRPSKTRRLMASRACRMSTMIGDSLNLNQMNRILKQMGTMDQPWACPHGRPTMRWLTRCDPGMNKKSENFLGKSFERIGCENFRFEISRLIKSYLG